jgi:hypothetical protein
MDTSEMQHEDIMRFIEDLFLVPRDVAESADVELTRESLTVTLPDGRTVTCPQRA